MTEEQKTYSKDELLEPHHRSLGQGAVRAGIFGVSDGLVSNVSLVLGFAGASASADFVRLAGIAGLVAGAFSMAAGEYISVKSERELLERELQMERRQLRDTPAFETQELAAIYEKRGVEKQLAMKLSEAIMKDPEIALDVHAREELGVDPKSLSSPINAMVSSFIAFVIGALIPLVPWFFSHGLTAIVSSIALSAVVALVLGWIIGSESGNSPIKSAMRQLFITGLAAGVTYIVGITIGTVN